MDTLYSLSLLAALTFGGVGATLLVWILARPGRDSTSAKRIAGASLFFFVTTIFCGGVSLAVHQIFGHGPSTPEPMTAARFFIFHKAYWLVLALALSSLLGAAIASRQARRNVSGGA